MPAVTVVYAETVATRLRVRMVYPDYAARMACDLAAKSGRPEIIVRHGGGVANCYGWPADTEGVVAVALSPCMAVVWHVRLPANKVTHSGVLAVALGSDARALDDARYGQAARDAAYRYAVEQAREFAA